MMGELPITKTERKWSYIYAYNIKTLRDIFVYCSMKKEIEEKQLYIAMAKNIIPPPGKQWINEKVKRKDRLRLEYIHAAKYLGLIKRKNGMLISDFDNFAVEKNLVIESNNNRQFKPSKKTVDLAQSEKWALTNILFNYERVRDYLFWFLDFKKYKDSNSFEISDFIEDGKPIFLLGKILLRKKGSDILKRKIDRKIWTIPNTYVRLSNSVFPNWFVELDLINKVVVFPEFSEDKRLWHMFYPIKISDENFLKKDIAKILETLFLKKTNKQSIWLPFLIYKMALKYSCTTRAIKLLLEKVYKEDYEHFYLERTSLPLMKRHSKYENSYIKVDGFYRSTIILTKRSSKK